MFFFYLELFNYLFFLKKTLFKFVKDACAHKARFEVQRSFQALLFKLSQIKEMELDSQFSILVHCCFVTLGAACACWLGFLSKSLFLISMGLLQGKC